MRGLERNRRLRNRTALRVYIREAMTFRDTFKPLAALAAPAALAGAFATSLLATGCTSILGDFSSAKGDASVSDDGGSDSATSDSTTVDGCTGSSCVDSGKSKGAPCTSDGECATGHCADKVCCESACSGTCESCNLTAGPPGTCAPIPANTDPDKECVSVPIVDAGLVEASPTDASAEGGEAGEGGPAADAGDGATPEASTDGATDAAGQEAAPPIYPPEAGVTTDDTKCVGSCDGNRACKYPDNATSCGTKWCNVAPGANGSGKLARMACDSTGHCTATALDQCMYYVCPAGDSACGTMCTSPSDCLPSSYCNTTGATGMCVPRLGNGVQCALDNQCHSNHCVSGVCCSDACNFPGGTCTATGAVGECKCSVDCGDGGTCQLFYRDADGDGFGDFLGATNGHSMVACAGSPPTGYVADNTDCNDNDANVFPTQTAYFGSPSTGTPLSGWDYNCDGMVEKSVPEYPGGSCQFCQGTAPACSESATCATAGQYAGFGCSSHYRFGFCNPITHICTVGGYYCGYDRNSAFEQTVNCGAYAPEYTCGTCSTTTAGTTATVSSASVQQQCH
jgi:hypothetical protein